MNPIFLDDITVTSKKLLVLLLEHAGHKMEIKINTSDIPGDMETKDIIADGAELHCNCGKKILID